MVISYLTLIVLIISLYVQYKRYSIKMILHPSTYFLFMWIVSLISFILYYNTSLKVVYTEKYLLELFHFVLFTGICFMIWGHKNAFRIKQSSINLELHIPKQVFTVFTIIFFTSSAFNLYKTGLNVAANRAMVNSNLFDQVSAGGNKGILDLIQEVILMLGLPFIIYGGWVIGTRYIKKNAKIEIIYFLPFITDVMNTISDGGRALIITSFLFFFIGFFMGFFTIPTSLKDYYTTFKPLLKYILGVIIIFSLYSGFVSSERSKLETGKSNSQYISALLNHYPKLEPISGILEYLVFHYQGYQWRRDESYDQELEWGQNTFAFITNYNVPVISQLSGVSVSLYNLFNLKYFDTVKGTMEAKKKDRMGFSITATVFIYMVKDFGYYGTFIITFLFVGFTQKLFERLFLHKNKSFWSIIFYIAVYKLWTMTFFSHHLSGVWFNSFLYPIFIIEFINYYLKKKAILKL